VLIEPTVATLAWVIFNGEWQECCGARTKTKLCWGAKTSAFIGALVIRPFEFRIPAAAYRPAPAGLRELSDRQERLLAPRIDHSEVRRQSGPPDQAGGLSTPNIDLNRP